MTQRGSQTPDENIDLSKVKPYELTLLLQRARTAMRVIRATVSMNHLISDKDKEDMWIAADDIERSLMKLNFPYL